MTVQVRRTHLLDALDNADVDSDQVRWDYSGRGMYGRTCFGFVGSIRQLTAFAYCLGYASGELHGSDDPRNWDEADELETVYTDLLADVTTDNMGYDTIFYFPSVEVVDDVVTHSEEGKVT